MHFLYQTLSDALCKIDALHLERDNLAVELTALQQGVEHERKVVHRRLFGNEKVNYVRAVICNKFSIKCL